jgi:hypothetical protein
MRMCATDTPPHGTIILLPCRIHISVRIYGHESLDNDIYPEREKARPQEKH